MKRRIHIRLSPSLAHKLDCVAGSNFGAKSALLEEALRARLEPEQIPRIDEVLIRRLNEHNRAIGSIARDVAIITETLALFVRYFLTITPPLPKSEQEPARLLGRQRFQVFVAQVGRRLAGDRRLISEVLETIANNDPDLFAVADGAPASRGGVVAPPPADAEAGGVSGASGAYAASNAPAVPEPAAGPEETERVPEPDGHG
jgi:AcrR family transcriptional regulator